MSETVNTNHNQMGKSSNSGKSLVKEKEKFQREKEGGRAVEGWDSILTQMSFFSLGTRRRLYVTLKVPSPRLLERNSKPFFPPLFSNHNSSEPWKEYGKAAFVFVTKLL